jgi:RNA polymerase sigma-70 factor (ECF subfamily)
MESQQFQDLLGRLRAGDRQAAADLIRAYEPEVRRFARMRLTDPRLRRTLESMDVCQSVLANFFVRAAAGQFDLHRPDDLLKLLATMVRNKVIDHARRPKNVAEAAGLDPERMASPEATPGRALAGRELLERARSRLKPDEQYLFDQRIAGRPWAELAQELGETPEALRKRYSRAVDRVANELGLEDSQG